VIASSLRERVEDLYSEYADALDERRLVDWVALFTDDGTYRAVSAENAARGLPLATMFCAGRGMLLDRTTAIQETLTYAPRLLRHMLSGIRVRRVEESVLFTEANFLVLETLDGEETRVFSSGRYRDEVVEQGDALRFREKLAVYDSSLVPTSLIFPL
jgi:3-phenylpropionate/cinnamic acid dioxygenase small subunit